MFKKIIATLLFVNPIVLLYGQDQNERKVSVFFGQVFSSLSYQDSNGETDNFLNNNIKSTYGVSYQQFIAGGFYIRPELSYKNFGAQSSVNNVNLDWDFHYLDLNLGAGFGRTSMFIHANYLIKPYAGGAFYMAYAYKADQLVGSQSFDLRKSDDFNKLDFGVNLNAGIFFDFSKDMGLMFEYRYNLGLRNLENNGSNSKQTMHNRAHAVAFGLCIKL